GSSGLVSEDWSELGLFLGADSESEVIFLLLSHLDVLCECWSFEITTPHSQTLLEEAQPKTVVDQPVDHARRFLLHKKAGYQRMRTILARQYSIQTPGIKHPMSFLLHMQLADNIMKEVDAEGMTACLCQTCKNHVFCTIYGPNHIWSCDGHDKLKRFGITVYGFLDSCLCLTKALKLLIWLPGKYISRINMVSSMSTCNQRIESLWSQMMKQHNCSIIDKILTQIYNGIYDPDDNLHKLVCYYSYSYGLQLFNPVWAFGLIFKIIIESGETTPSHQLLALHTLHTFLLQRDYPDIEAMFTHTPDCFHEVAVAIMAALEINSEHITIGNFWHIFSSMLPSIQLHFQHHEYPDLSPQHSEEIQASKSDEG
ncbi:hypothetical protein VP01_4316g1, partial [Puccinia sorghi]